VRFSYTILKNRRKVIFTPAPGMGRNLVVKVRWQPVGNRLPGYSPKTSAVKVKSRAPGAS
jgi:hypothetical protein